MKKKSGKYISRVMILVVSLIVLAFSGTYAYFTVNFTGETTTTTAKTGVFKVESSLERASAIKNSRMVLISENEKNSKAEKLEFTITSKSETTVDGKYNVYLQDIQLSKNMYSKYLKWELLRENQIISSGDFADVSRKDTEQSNEEANANTIAEDFKLNENAISLTKKTTDHLIFRIWLENDPNVNQISLANGTFSGKLYIEAVPVSNMSNS